MSELFTDMIEHVTECYDYPTGRMKAEDQLAALLDEIVRLEANKKWWQDVAQKWKTVAQASDPVGLLYKLRKELLQQVAVLDLVIAEHEGNN